MPDLIRTTSPSLPPACSGLAYALQREGRNKSEKVAVFSLQAPKWEKSRQRRDPGPRAQFHSRPTASDFPLSDPIPSVDQSSSSPPPRPKRPRAPQLTSFRQCFLCHACQSSANIRLRDGNGNRPLGGPQLPNHFRHFFYLLPACCPDQTRLSWCSAHFRQSPDKM
jgi:hypothetical protein